MTLKDQLMDWDEAHRSDPFAAMRMASHIRNGVAQPHDYSTTTIAIPAKTVDGRERLVNRIVPNEEPFS